MWPDLLVTVYNRIYLEWFFLDNNVFFSVLCDPGFTYLPLAKSCYKVVYEYHDWTSAARRCEKLCRGSYLAAITTAEQDEALKAFIAQDLARMYIRVNLPAEHSSS